MLQYGFLQRHDVLVYGPPFVPADTMIVVQKQKKKKSINTLPQPAFSRFFYINRAFKPMAK
jgi:hypothetical protein